MRKKLFQEITVIVIIAVALGLIYNVTVKGIPFIYEPKVLVEAEGFDDMFNNETNSEISANPEETASVNAIDTTAKMPAEETTENESGNEEKQVQIDTAGPAQKTGDAKTGEENVDTNTIAEGGKEIADPSGNATDKPSSEERTLDQIFKETIKYKQLLTKIGNPNIIIIDARSPVQFEKGHIKGSVNIYPHEENESAYFEKLVSIPFEKVIVVYCDGGACSLSHEVIEQLHALGYRKLFLYSGGWEDWLENRGKISKD